jgi:hypothetical protein
VIITAHPNGVYEKIKNFTLSGGCGRAESMGDDRITIYKGYNGCIAGTYNFSLDYHAGTIVSNEGVRRCSGRIGISGHKHSVYMGVNSRCNVFLNR